MDLSLGPPDEARQHLHLLLLDLTGFVGFLDHLAALAADLIVPGASVGITVVRGGRPATVSSTDQRAAQVDELQYCEGVGPCLQALATQQVVLVPDLLVDERWPAFAARATAQGVRSCLALPFASPGLLGAINIYASAVDAFEDDARRRAERFNVEARRAIELVCLTDRQELSPPLRDALEPRWEIDQAVGLLMGLNHCAADEALTTLQASAHRRHTTLLDAAHQLFAEVGGP